MSFARKVIQDLVEKRLWPVALLMVLALVAIPVIGGGGGDPAPGAAKPALPIAPGDAVDSKPVLDPVGPPSVRKRDGTNVDPFRRQPKAKETSTPTTATASGSEGASGLGSSGGAGGSDLGSADTGTGAPAQDDSTATQDDSTKSDVKKSDPKRSVYRTTVRWSSGDPAKARRILRLTPLGSLDTSALLYLGVDEDGKRALFLLGLGATSIGDAKCPNDDCRIISLAKGDTQTVALQPAGAAATQFELKLVSIKRDELTTAARASKSRAKERSKGRDILRSLIQDAATAHAIGAFAYDRGKGVMVEAATSSKVDAP